MDSTSPTKIDTVPPPAGADFSLLILKPLFHALAQDVGEMVLSEIGHEVGLTAGDLLQGQRWVTHGDLEALMRLARARYGSDAEFMNACARDMTKYWGIAALVFRAGTILMSYKVLAKTTHVVSHVSDYEMSEGTARSVTLTYRSKKPESRLMCLSRQAQLPCVPLMFWKLAPARLTETRCIAHGDDACVYNLRWSEPLAWRIPALGALIGGLGAGVAYAGGWEPHTAAFLPLVGALMGAAFAFRRMVEQSHAFHAETTERVGELVTAHHSAIDEVMALHQRQEAYNAMLEDRIESRTATLEAMVRELRGIREKSGTALKGLSHDIRNPLQVVKLNAQALSEYPDKEVAEVAEQITESLVRVEAHIQRLAMLATAEKDAFALKAERVDVGPVADRLRKHLQALVIARDIRVSVFRTREAPDAIETDLMLFDRVLDNILSNAVKYTERGSIVVEVGGAPEKLSIKVSDTGRGIAPERLEKVFVGGQRDERPLLGESHGIGLANTVRLLDQLGARLEVMSKPGVGTTVWAHFPMMPPPATPHPSLRPGPREMLARVVTIRNAANE